MTSPEPMSREELLEMAPLDAFGLLDDFEAALFNRSFHHAPASVQAEIRSLQADLAESAAFVSPEEPRGLLRQKVLIRVAEEVEDAAEALKPLATIGSQQPLVGSGASNAIAVRISSAPPSQNETMRELVAEIRSRSSGGVRDRTTPYWRAAAFFLAAGLVASLYFLTSTMRTAERIAQLAQQQVLREQLRQLVPNLNDFVYRNSHIRSLTSADSAVNGAATLYVDRDNHRALIIALGLSDSKGPFTLRAVDDLNNATVIKTFPSSDPVCAIVIENIPDDMLVRKLELLDGAGNVILRTA